MIHRDFSDKLQYFATKFPCIALMGPRQSGKTTLVKTVFPQHKYILLEEPDVKEYAERDPRGFLAKQPTDQGIILDEIQEAPHLLSYIQGIVDREYKPGFFIITGSQNFAINQAITQTLAGRIGMFTLLPLSLHELKNAGLLTSPEDALFKGGYPRIYVQDFKPDEWYPSYIGNYVERDVRQIIAIENLALFQKFVRLCAGRVGQLLNLTSLGNDCGISHNTARSWISLLEASYIVFLLQPHHANFNKRLIKSPKLYFYDTGLACSLLKITEVEQLDNHYMRGGLFESMIISDIIKARYNAGKEPNTYFWRDSQGHEIDCLLEEASRLIPIEIKSGYTINTDFFKGLTEWNKISSSFPENNIVVYAGNETQKRSSGLVMPWDMVARDVV